MQTIKKLLHKDNVQVKLNGVVVAEASRDKIRIVEGNVGSSFLSIPIPIISFLSFPLQPNMLFYLLSLEILSSGFIAQTVLPGQ